MHHSRTDLTEVTLIEIEQQKKNLQILPEKYIVFFSVRLLVVPIHSVLN